MAKGSSNSNGSRTWLLLLGAIGFGIAAAVLSVVYLKAREAALIEQLGADEKRTVAVVVANQDLPKGAQITTAIAAVREIPVDFVHPNAITPNNFSSVEGKVLVEDVPQGKPILDSFIDQDFPMDFSDTIPVGRRAMTINVDEINSQANLTRPGNHIDLYVNIPADVTGFEVPGSRGGGLQQVGGGAAAFTEPTGPQVSDVVMPVLQDVRVLATGREGYDDFQEQLLRGTFRTQAYTTMTIDVTPEQAALLTAAEDNGDLLALLRNRKDRGGAKFAGITTADLLENSQDMRKAALVRESQRSADDLVVGPDGKIRTKDGTVLKNQDNLVVDEDGTIRTKGERHTDFVKNEDGSVTLADGTVLEEGEYTVNEDGSITTKGKDIAGLGLTVNENGEIVGPDGKAVDPNDVITTKDGIVMTKDGKILKGPKGTKVTKDGFIVTEDGTVMTKDGTVLEGVSVNENGEVVTKDGTVLKADNVQLNPDGTVTTKGERHTDFTKNADGSVTLADGTVLEEGEYTVNEDGSITTKGKQLAGVTGSKDPERARTLQAALGVDSAEDAAAAAADAQQEDGMDYIGYLRGGVSKDGVATPGQLPVLPVKQAEVNINFNLPQQGATAPVAPQVPGAAQ